MTAHFHNRMSELKARRRMVRMPRSYTRTAPPKPIKADSEALRHIAACLRRAGMLNFADVIERAAKVLAQHESTPD